MLVFALYRACAFFLFEHIGLPALDVDSGRLDAALSDEAGDAVLFFCGTAAVEADVSAC